MKKYLSMIITTVAAITATVIFVKKLKELKIEGKLQKISFNSHLYENHLKRGFDVFCSLMAIICFGWLYIIVAVLVKIKLGSPVIFKQPRPGKDGKIFNMYKFRTMTDEKDEEGNLLPDEVRLTSFGKKLRATSLDELPEAFNILKGDMSIIGPRPQLVRDMVFMTKEQKKRHTVRPGLSGLAQIKGRNDIDWDDKLNWDLKYIKKITFLGDLRIIFETVIKAFVKQEGITDGDMATAEDYGDYLLHNGKVSQEEYDEKQEEAGQILKIDRNSFDNSNERKVLIVASVVSFIEWFNKENIDFLHKKLGYDVEIACNFDYMDDTDVERTKKYITKLRNNGIKLHNIQFERNPLSVKNIIAFKNLKRIINNGNYKLIHCHTPVASMMTRIASIKVRKQGTVVMYTCHGFHFHNSAPKKNWMIYYPIEKQLSRFCDYIVTINKEDYHRAKKFYCKNVRYIPGVGVDFKKIKNIKVDKIKLRREIGIPCDAFVIISVGELIERKNHEVILRAIAKCKKKDIYYVIAGKGELYDYLNDLTKELGIEENVRFLGLELIFMNYIM